MIYAFLADGFEEIEAITPIDLLKRCGKEVCIVGVNDILITGSHNIKISADILMKDICLDDNLEMIILPGGMPGTTNLEASKDVINAINFCVDNNIFIGAICAAPSILGKMGLLKNKTATCYNGFEKYLEGAIISDSPAVADGNIITSRGAGASIKFALLLIEKLISKEKSDEIKNSILCD